MWNRIFVLYVGLFRSPKRQKTILTEKYVCKGLNDFVYRGRNAFIYTGLNDVVYKGRNVLVHAGFNNFVYTGRNAFDIYRLE